jgi:hypothetical protein
MRLLNVHTFKLESFDNPKARPPYAILSHRWREGEVLFNDLRDPAYSGVVLALTERIRSLEIRLGAADEKAEIDPWNFQLHAAKQKPGWSKIKNCCAEAANCGLGYVWIDTCCIDKESSTELSEAINSMFSWYKDSKMCFAYLDDVSTYRPLGDSEWFKRGWTLQELIAPHEVFFYQRDWRFIGFRSSMATFLSKVTGISHDILCQGTAKAQEEKTHFSRSSTHKQRTISQFSAAVKFSWASARTTSREEDQSYSLLGLFGLNMPILYGEGGQAAFYRLQTEIFRATGDHTIFAWRHPSLSSNHGYASPLCNIVRHEQSGSLSFTGTYVNHPDTALGNLLSPSVCYFNDSDIENEPYDEKLLKSLAPLNEKSKTLEYSFFSHGLCVQLILERVAGILESCEWFLAHLACKSTRTGNRIGVYLSLGHAGTYQRRGPRTLLEIGSFNARLADIRLENVYINSLDTFHTHNVQNPFCYYTPPNFLHLNTECLESSGYLIKYGLSAFGTEKYNENSRTETAVKIGPSQWKLERPIGSEVIYACLFESSRWSYSPAPGQANAGMGQRPRPKYCSFIFIIRMGRGETEFYINDTWFQHSYFAGPHQPAQSEGESELVRLSEFISGYSTTLRSHPTLGDIVPGAMASSVEHSTMLRHDLPWGDIILADVRFDRLSPWVCSEVRLFMKEQPQPPPVKKHRKPLITGTVHPSRRKRAKSVVNPDASKDNTDSPYSTSNQSETKWSLYTPSITALHHVRDCTSGVAAIQGRLLITYPKYARSIKSTWSR